MLVVSLSLWIVVAQINIIGSGIIGLIIILIIQCIISHRLLWCLFGYESIAIKNDYLIIRRRGSVLVRTKSYNINNVSYFTLTHDNHKPINSGTKTTVFLKSIFFNFNNMGTISFEYDTKQHKFLHLYERDMTNDIYGKMKKAIFPLE